LFFLYYEYLFLIYPVKCNPYTRVGNYSIYIGFERSDVIAILII